MIVSSHSLCWCAAALTPLSLTVDCIRDVHIYYNDSHHRGHFHRWCVWPLPCVSQATDRPMGMNGLDVAGLRPFDLVIPFTIQKGEITGNIMRSALQWAQTDGTPVCSVVWISLCVLSSAEGEVRMPSGKVAKPDITDNKDGTVTVKYAPTEAGLHEMDIKYDGIHIPGTTCLWSVLCFYSCPIPNTWPIPCGITRHKTCLPVITQQKSNLKNQVNISITGLYVYFPVSLI